MLTGSEILSIVTIIECALMLAQAQTHTFTLKV